MLICIDSCVFIRGINQDRSAAGQLLDLIGPDLPVVIHRLIAREVTRNLFGQPQRRVFFRMFYKNASASIVDSSIPVVFLERYVSLGLREKGDAVIGAFAEWMQVDDLSSDNRHFLRELPTPPYQVATPEVFLGRRS